MLKGSAQVLTPFAAVSSLAASSKQSPRLGLVYGAAAIVCIGAIGVALRLVIASGDPLWVDELHTSWCASGPLSDVARRANLGNQEPLYYWLNWFVSEVLSQSPLTLRIVSVAAGSLTIVWGGLAVFRRTGSTLAGICTSLLVAADPNLLFYSTEARPFALIQLATLIAALQAVDFFSNELSAIRQARIGTAPESELRRRFPVELIAVAMLLVSLHPTSILFVATLSIGCFAAWGYLVVKNGGDPATLELPAGTHLRLGARRFFVLGAALICVGVLMLAISENTIQVWSRRSQWVAMSDWRELAVDMALITIAFWLIPWLVSIVSDRCLGKRDSARANLGAFSWLMFGLFAGPVSIAILADLVGVAPLANQRYLSQVWAIPSLAAGAAVAICYSRFARTVSMIAIVGCVWCIPAPEYAHGRLQFRVRNTWIADVVRSGRLLGFRTEGWEEAVSYVSEALRSSPNRETVFLFPNLIEEDQIDQQWILNDAQKEYLQYPVSGIYPLKATVEPLPFRRTAHLRETNCHQILVGGFTFIIVRCGYADVGLLVDELKLDLQTYEYDGLYSIDFERSFGDVHVLRIWPISQTIR